MMQWIDVQNARSAKHCVLPRIAFEYKRRTTVAVHMCFYIVRLIIYCTRPYKEKDFSGLKKKIKLKIFTENS